MIIGEEESVVVDVSAVQDDSTLLFDHMISNGEQQVILNALGSKFVIPRNSSFLMV